MDTIIQISMGTSIVLSPRRTIYGFINEAGGEPLFSTKKKRTWETVVKIFSVSIQGARQYSAQQEFTILTSP